MAQCGSNLSVAEGQCSQTHATYESCHAQVSDYLHQANFESVALTCAMYLCAERAHQHMTAPTQTDADARDGSNLL
jgi:hypothetical protein